MRWRLPAVLVSLLAMAACQARAEPSGRFRVLTTVAPLTSIASAISGGEADVTGLVPEGTNSHTFEPAPSMVEKIARADLIFVNGLNLEDPTLELAERNKAKRARVVRLGDTVLPRQDYIFDFSFPEEGGKPNPHLWTDPGYAKGYAEVMRDSLVELDPRGANSYRRNFEIFAGKVDELDAAMRVALATVPPDRRKLLTYHDSFAYFARSYGWKVVGAIQVRSFDDPSAREVARLIEQVRAERVAAIFGSEVFPSPVLARIGKETGVPYVDVLRDDDLPGKPGEPEHSWLGLMRFDYATIVEALGGDASRLRALDLETGVPDRATYPQ